MAIPKGLLTATVFFHVFIFINGQNDPNSTESTPPFPLQLESFFSITFDFDVEDGKIDDFIAHTLFNNPTKYNISTSDFLNAIPATDVVYTQISELLEFFNASRNDFLTEEVLTSLNISLYSTYQIVRANFFTDVRAEEPLILDIFGINRVNFTDVILYGNDASLYEILRTGNFTEETINSAFQVANKTPEQLYDFVQPIWVESIRTLSLTSLMGVFERYNITEGHVHQLLTELGVLPGNYFAIDSFLAAVEDCRKNANDEPILGIVLNASSVITVGSVVGKYRQVERFLDVYVEDFVTPKGVYKVGDVSPYDGNCVYGPVVLTRSYANITGVKAVLLASDESHMQNCTYVTVVEGVVVETPVRVDGDENVVIVSVTNSTVFNLGSPLICEGVLYGVAEQKQNNQIGFRRLECDPESHDVTTIFPSNSAESRSLGEITYLIVLVLVAVRVASC